MDVIDRSSEEGRGEYTYKYPTDTEYYRNMSDFVLKSCYTKLTEEEVDIFLIRQIEKEFKNHDKVKEPEDKNYRTAIFYMIVLPLIILLAACLL